MNKVELLFVYGTLRRGIATAPGARLASRARWRERCSVKGRLYNAGDYPALIPEEGEGRVSGELYEIAADEWVELVGELDAYEGCGRDDPHPHLFERVRVTALLNDGQEVEAWTYRYNHPIDALEAIQGGDYLEWLGGR